MYGSHTTYGSLGSKRVLAIREVRITIAKMCTDRTVHVIRVACAKHVLDQNTMYASYDPSVQEDGHDPCTTWPVRHLKYTNGFNIFIFLSRVTVEYAKCSLVLFWRRNVPILHTQRIITNKHYLGQTKQKKRQNTKKVTVATARTETKLPVCCKQENSRGLGSANRASNLPKIYLITSWHLPLDHVSHLLVVNKFSIHFNCQVAQ